MPHVQSFGLLVLNNNCPQSVWKDEQGREYVGHIIELHCGWIVAIVRSDPFWVMEQAFLGPEHNHSSVGRRLIAWATEMDLRSEGSN